MKRKRRLKKPIKRALIIILIIALIKILFIGETETTNTPAGSYTCSGGLIKICTGSQAVADAEGIE
jgi:hypothetical protein